MDNKATLTKGSVSSVILKQTGPMIIGMLGIVIFNLVDTFFIGKLGTEALAAMGFTIPVVMLQGAIAMGLGVGTSAVVSRAIGEGDEYEVKRLTTDSLLLSITIVTVIITVGIFTITPLFSGMGAKNHILELVRQYIFIWYLGVPFVVIPMIGNNAIRAAGNTVIPSTIMMIAVIINIILDPILIFGWGKIPALGLKGAAIATVFARFTTFTASLLILHFKFNMLTIHIPSFTIIKDSWYRILHIGTPAAITQLLIPFTLFFLTKIIAGFGEEAVAAMGVSSRLEMLALSPIMALSATMIPFIGQNDGAGKIDRIKSGINFSFKIALIGGAVSSLILILGGRFFASKFDSNPEVINITAKYLSIASLSYGFLGISWICSSSFSALKKPLNSTMLNFIKMIILYLPFAWIFSKTFGLTGIFWSASLSSFAVGIIGVLWIKKSLNSHE